MGHNLLFALRYFLPLFLGGMIALNSCKEERASINDDPGQGDDGGDEYEYVDDRIFLSLLKTVQQEIIRITVQRKEWLSVKAEKL